MHQKVSGFCYGSEMSYGFEMSSAWVYFGLSGY